MRILFFIPSMTGGGAERVISIIASRMAQIGHSVGILTINSCESKYKIDENVSIYTLNCPANSRSSLLRMLSLPFIECKRIAYFKRFIKLYNPDNVVSFSLTTNLITILAGKFRGERHILSERTDPLRFSFITRRICEIVYRKADALVVQSSAIGEYYSAHGIKSIYIIPNPVCDQVAVMSKCDFKSKPLICAAGRLINEKNYPMLIDAFARVCSEIPGFELWICGEGYLYDRILRYIDALGLSERVKLLGFRDDVHAIIASSTLFVMTSDYEGFPNVLIEAMSLGVPVISTDFSSGVARDYIIDGINGYLIQKGNTGQLVSAIRKAIDDKQIMKANCLKLRHSLIQKLDPEKITDLWLACMNDRQKEES